MSDNYQQTNLTLQREARTLNSLQPSDALSPLALDGIASYSEKLGLTPREEAVFSCIIRGYSHSETALMLGISDNTVKTHIRNVLGKSSCRNCAELMSRLFFYIHAGQPSRLRPRLLWIDDYPANNQNILDHLSQHVLGVDLAISTAQALDRLREYPYDFIISDMGRGTDLDAGMTMFDVFRAEQLNVPWVVIFTSTSAARRLGRQALLQGAQGVFDESLPLLQSLQRLRIC